MAKTKTKPFEVADYLTTAQARAEYMTAALETGDMEFIRDAIGVVAKAVGMAKVAQQAGISREGLYRALGRSGNPEFGTVINLLPALQLKLSAQPVRSKRSATRHVAVKRAFRSGARSKRRRG